MKRIAIILFVGLMAPGLGVFSYSSVYTYQIEEELPAGGEMLTANGAETHVMRSGSAGAPILMIHGAGGNAREFEVTLAPYLQSTHRIIAVDRPGHGYSERVDDARKLAVQSAQMAAVLETTVPGEKSVIVGHSYGTAVALRLALDRPDLVKGLVLLAPVSHDWGPGKVAWFNSYSSPPITGHALSHLITIFGPSQAREQLWQTFDPAPAPEGYYDEAGIGLMFRPATFRANARELASLREELIAQQTRYAEIDAPSIVLSGSADISMDPSIHTEGLRQQVPKIEIIKFPDEGHVPHVRKRKEVVAAILGLANSEVSADKGIARD